MGTESKENKSIDLQSNKKATGCCGCAVVLAVAIGLVSCSGIFKSSEKPQKTNTTQTQTANVEHRTGENIIGISNKNIDDLSPLYSDNVRNDSTGNWRYISITKTDVSIADYALSVYNNYFDDNSNIFAIVNFSTKTTTKISCYGTYLDIVVYEYVDGEERDANKMFSGMVYGHYMVYTDNGDIEEIK